jgi:hypothetical protein
MDEFEFMEYIAGLLNADADVINEARYEPDPGYIYAKTHSDKEFIVDVRES